MKKVMHIAQASGGVDRYLKMFLKNLDPFKYDNILVCSYEYDKDDYKDLVSSFEYVEMIREISPKSDLRAVIKVRKLIKKYNPDIVYMHSSKAGAIGRLANYNINNRSIYNPHGWSFNIDCGNVKKNIYRQIEKLLAPLSDTIIAISDFEKESAIRSGICKEDKIKIIYNGIDIEDYNKKKSRYKLTKEKLGIPSDAYVIGTIGRLSKQKAPDIFIQAAAKIKREIPNAYFIMVGDGDESKKVKKLILEYGLERSVLITGWVDEPIEYLQIFDQAMLLSRWEGFGLVLAEYMLARKPIVATNVDAIPNLIKNGINGLLVPKDDAEAVFNASMKLVKNRELCKSLTKLGYEVVKSKFDIKRVVEEFNMLIS